MTDTRRHPWKLAQKVACGLALLSLVTPALARKPLAKSGADDVIVDDRTQRILDSSLKFLAAKQQPNGSWVESDRNHAAAITAYVLIAFMTTGNLPNEGPYGQNVRRGLDFLLNCVRPDGYIAAAEGTSNMYGHGIATIALAEMYGTTQDESIRPKLERAVKLIQKAQSPLGGWRYNPRPEDADVSVTVLQVVALRAAKNSGIEVPQNIIDRAVNFIHKCSVAGTGGFSYQAANNNAKGGKPGWARTGAAVYSLQVCGQYDDPLVAAGSKYLFDQFGIDKEYVSYGINYATPANYMIGGDVWRRWYGMVRERLLREVKPLGDKTYWPSSGPGGDAYGTAVNISALAMPYGYLPLYQR